MAVRVEYWIRVTRMGYERYRVHLVSGREQMQLCTLPTGPDAVEYAQRMVRFLTNETPGALYEPDADLLYEQSFEVIQHLAEENERLNPRGKDGR